MVGASRSPNKPQCCFHRYLKPGALARLRDSRIGAARSLQPKSPPPSSILDSDLRIPLQSSPNDDDIPFLLAKLYRPHSLNRKRLVAARSVVFAGLPPPSNQLLDPTNRGDGGISHGNSNGSAMVALNSDAVVAAH
ncbi:hypothetical protein LINGRAHAP2_LOCUS29228 [Linum grandiflorum]